MSIVPCRWAGPSLLPSPRRTFRHRCRFRRAIQPDIRKCPWWRRGALRVRRSLGEGGTPRDFALAAQARAVGAPRPQAALTNDAVDSRGRVAAASRWVLCPPLTLITGNGFKDEVRHFAAELA
jgi:hypothetical protein